MTASAWGGDDHFACIKDTSQFNGLPYEERAILAYACRANDNANYYMSGIKGQYHGGLWNTWTAGDVDCNYIACYIYLTKVANAFGGNGTLAAAKSYLTTIDPNAANVMYGNGAGYVINTAGILNSSGASWITWEKIFGSSDPNSTNYSENCLNAWVYNNCRGWADYTGDITPSKPLERTFVYGMAIHDATDVFAHSSWYYNNGEWQQITHTNDTDNDGKKDADDPDIRLGRYNAAKLVALNILNRYLAGSSSSGDVTDFKIATSNYSFSTTALTSDNAFRLGNIYHYANKCGLSSGDVTYFQVPDAARTIDIFNLGTLNFQNHNTHWNSSTHTLTE